MFLVRSITLVSAASVLSLGTAYAGELDPRQHQDLFDGMMLELDEAPLSSDALGEARGGFSVGGLNFNIGVVVPPVVIAPVFPDGGPLPNGPLPNGPFGASGGPLPNGVFGNNNNASNQPQANAAPPSTGLVLANNPAPAAPQVTTPVVNTPAAPVVNVQPPVVNTPAATGAQVQTPVVNTPATPVVNVQPPVVNTPAAPVAQVQTPVVNTPAAPVVDVQTPTVNTPASPLPVLQTAPTVTTPANIVESNIDTGGAGAANNNPPASGAVSSPNIGQGGGASSGPALTAADPSALPKALPAAPQSHVAQDVGASGVTTIVNNALNNVRLTQQVQLNVEVSNYSFVMNMTRANSVTVQAVTQSFFIGGLN